MSVIARFLVLAEPSGPFTRRDGPRRVLKEPIKRITKQTRHNQSQTNERDPIVPLGQRRGTNGDLRESHDSQQRTIATRGLEHRT
jgi:hypothetical protein